MTLHKSRRRPSKGLLDVSVVAVDEQVSMSAGPCRENGIGGRRIRTCRNREVLRRLGMSEDTKSGVRRGASVMKIQLGFDLGVMCKLRVCCLNHIGESPGLCLNDTCWDIRFLKGRYRVAKRRYTGICP